MSVEDQSSIDVREAVNIIAGELLYTGLLTEGFVILATKVIKPEADYPLQDVVSSFEQLGLPSELLAVILVLIGGLGFRHLLTMADNTDIPFNPGSSSDG